MSNFYMPFIGPAPAGVDPTTYYGGFSITVNATNHGNDGITFEIIGAGSNVPIFSIAGGGVSFVPAGNLIPNLSGISFVQKPDKLTT